MKLQDLYTRGVLLEDGPRASPEINAERFLSPKSDGVLAAGEAFKPNYSFDELFRQLDVLEKDGNYKEAYFLTKNLLTKSHISGLNRQTVRKDPGAKYIYIRGDLDKMKWLNDESGLTHDGVNIIIQTLGNLIMKHVEAKEGIDLSKVTLDYVEGVKNVGGDSGTQHGKFYHPHGDEFGGQVNVSKLSDEQIGYSIALITSGLMNVADELANNLFYPSLEAYHSKDIGKSVRATVSFGISMQSDAMADKILQRTKSAKVRYAVTVDQNLINKYIKPNRKIAGFINEIMNRSKGAEVMASLSEAKNKALEAVTFRPGCLLLELDPLSIPMHEMLELENIIRKKRAYLKDPNGFCPIKYGNNEVSYTPLKEPYNGLGYL